LVIALALVSAIFVKDLKFVIEWSGTILGIPIAFILPSILFLRLEHGVWYSSPKKLLYSFILLFGIISMFASIGTLFLQLQQQ